MIHELYTNLASELRSNSNVPLLETDTSSQGKSMLERVKCEDRLEQQISSTWRKMEQGGGPESMQQGVVDAYKKEMSLDLLTDPGLSPSLLQNIKPQRIQQSARHEIPAPVPAMKPVTIHQTPSSQVSQPKPAVADPPKQMQPSPLQRRPALPFHPELDSGHNSGFQDDYVAPNQVRPEPPISMPKPRPKVSVTPAQQPSERPMKDRTPGFGFQALAIPSQETTISSGDSQLKPPSRATKPISREETTRPTAPPQQPTTSRGMLNTGLGRTDNYNLNPSAFGQKSGDQSSSNKPTTQPWEYNKSALTYSQVLKKAPTESALFNTPGLYETERKKLRDNLMLKREMEFQQQLEVARMQSRGNNDSHRKSDFRVNPSQIYYGQYVADVSYNPHQEYLINLSERAHQSNDEVRKYQVQLKMLQNSVTTSEKAANLFEKQVDRQTTQATDLNTRAEILATEVSSLAQQKEDLILKLERKRAELMEQKRRAHATSDSDQYRKRDLQEENASLRRLISYKASEKSRLKSKYDQLEQEYSQHSALKTADFASPNKVLDRVLSRSAMVDWAPWRERFEDIPGTKSRKAHADMGSTMAGAESRGFLSELNRSVDKLLMNRPEQESRFI